MAAHTVRGYLTSIARRHVWVHEGNLKKLITELKCVRVWSKGLIVWFPPKRVTVLEWNLNIVLSTLKKLPYYDKDLRSIVRKRLTHRTAFLVALTTVRRISEVSIITCSTIKFSAKKQFSTCTRGFSPSRDLSGT